VALVYADPTPLLDAPLEIASPIATRLPGYRPIQPMPNFVSTFHPTRYGLVDGAAGGPFLNATTLRVFETEAQARAQLESACREYTRHCGENLVRRPANPGGEACVAPFWRERGSLHDGYGFQDFETEMSVRRGRLVVEIHGIALEQSPEQAAARVTAIAAEIADKLRVTDSRRSASDSFSP